MSYYGEKGGIPPTVPRPALGTRSSTYRTIHSNLMSFYSRDGVLDQQQSGVVGGGGGGEGAEVAGRAGIVEDDKSETAVSRSSSRQQQQNLVGESRQTPAGELAESTKESVPEEPRLYGFEKLAQKNPGPWEHTSMTIGPPIIVLFDIVVPCIIYYIWFDKHRAQWVDTCNADYISQGQTCPIPKPQYDKDILGYSVISFGFGELYILLARVYRLYVERDICAPLLSRSKWELDATSWVYLTAMIVALIPFVVGAALEIPELYLYGPSFLMGFLGVIMVITMIPFPIPIGINSHARGTALRPFIYYAAEDFIAVDGLQDREFRVRYNQRYDTDRNFRLMFLELTIWWITGVIVYLGCVSAVIWKLEFHYAFGLSLGVLFSYIIIWAGVSVFWVRFRMHQMKKARMGPIPNNV